MATNPDEQKTVDAATDAARDAADALQPPADILVVEDEKSAALVVHVVADTLVVYRVPMPFDPAAKHEIIAEPVDKYRAVLFQNCHGVNIFVLTKLLKCSFVECVGCTVTVGTDMIGAAEFYKCKQCDVTFNALVNVVQVGSCSRVRFIHAEACASEVMYALNISLDISCAILVGARIAREEIIANTFENLTTQRIVCVTRRENALFFTESFVRNLDLKNTEASLFIGWNEFEDGRSTRGDWLARR